MKKIIAFSALLALFAGQVRAQETASPKLPTVSFSKGVGITTPDSSFSLNLRFRMQNRVIYNTASAEDLTPSEIEARVRRLRLRLEGFMYNPKLTYYIQLSFSRGDMDWSMRQNSAVNESPNVVRDAVVYYQPAPQLQLVFGQTKLPGNRQRVVSSGELQFADRSIVNATYNIDRDFGLQFNYTNSIGKSVVVVKGALTTGDGRNVTVTDKGLAYTGRVEVLPFGKFTNKGDYFEGDLEREQTVKLSLAGGMSHNEKARRTGGQIGRDLFTPRDIRTYIFDGLLKYRGYALTAEHIRRETPNPITISPANETRHITEGHGTLVQTSYIFRNNFEIAARYANVTPDQSIWHLEPVEDVYTAGVTKYLRGHRLKLQTNLSFHDLSATASRPGRNNWSAAFQIELGI